MLLGLAYQLTRYLTDLILVRTGSDAQLRAEVLALRHQLGVLERKVGKPAWQPGDRFLLAALSQLLPRSAWSALLPKPETLLRVNGAFCIDAIPPMMAALGGDYKGRDRGGLTG
jgi:putative transposase